MVAPLREQLQSYQYAGVSHTEGKTMLQLILKIG